MLTFEDNFYGPGYHMPAPPPKLLLVAYVIPIGGERNRRVMNIKLSSS